MFSCTSFVFLLFSSFLLFSNFVVIDVLCSGWSDVVSESELVLRDVDLCDSCVVVCWKCLFSGVVSSSGNTNIYWVHENAEFSSSSSFTLRFLALVKIV